MTRPRSKYWVPLLIGGSAGAAYAWLGVPPAGESADAPDPPSVALSATSPAPALAPSPTLTASGPPSGALAAATNSGSEGAPSAPESTLSAPSAAASVAPPATATQTGAPRPAFNLSPPNTEQALLATQLRCNAKSPEDCERAAHSLESGAFGLAKDPKRARALRRLALTLYVKQCETKRAAACARLAEMYTTGESVKPNARSAKALRERVHELCAKDPSEDVCR